jgi:cytochrome c biogenesis protein CcmG, thiol:disulfide interchange protein DsbE
MPPNDDMALSPVGGSAAATSPPSATWTRWGRRLLLTAPLIGFAVLVAAFAARLGSDPNIVPSPLIGKPVPEFDLPPVKGRLLGLASADLKGEVSLVNVFASWCVPCREEHPVLLQLKSAGTVPIHGLNYKDRPDDAAKWLDTVGDPYTRTGADINGRVGIDFGVYGVPETFVIDAAGRIAFKQIGAITPETLAGTILPLVAKLRADGARPQ